MSTIWPTIWTALAVILYSAVFYGVIHSVREPPAQQPVPNLLVWGGSFGFALVWHSTCVYDALTNWGDDSFSSLNLLQQSGLIALSLMLIIALFWLSERKSRYLESLFQSWSLPRLSVLLVDLPLTIVTFVLLHRASAQIYYVYYQFIFVDLPLQWVINTKFELAGLVDFLLAELLADSVNRLSDLLASLALWTLVLNLIWRQIKQLKL
jgi:hypothetical protein